MSDFGRNAELSRLTSGAEGERRLGPFLLLRQLGRGGFAPVWLARETYGETELRMVAVKLFSVARSHGSSAPADTSLRDRVVEEARLLSRVEHPNIVRFYSLAVDDERGVVGLAMEYVAGISLDRRLETGALETNEALVVGISIASALSAVHRSGLVHRDVKPANVVDAAGVHKLIDFGIAATERGPGAPRTVRPSRVVVDDLPLEVLGSRASVLESTTAQDASGSHTLVTGTVGYVDPVCVSSRSAAVPASDLYGLGALLFECITGKLPAAKASSTGLSGAVLDGREPPPPIRTLAPNLPPALGALIDSLLAPVRTQRPRSAEWVTRELERIRSELSGRKRELPSEDVGPFRGLGRFEASHRDIYFGRTVEVAGALEMLRSRGLVALIGPSGSGKSSLARAGILPAIAEGALGTWPAQWDTIVVSPGDDPRSMLGSALAALIPGADSMTADELVARMAERVQQTSRGIFLLVDQLEELATLSTGEGQSWMVSLLARLGEETIPGVRTLATARQDLLDAVLRLSTLGRALGRGSLIVVTPLTDDAWIDVLDQALAAYGYEPEDARLRAELLEQLSGTATAMPLVQFALTQLWEQRDRAKRRLTWNALYSIGGISGALERHADLTLAEIEKSNPRARMIVKRVLMELTTPEGTRATMTEAHVLAAAGSPIARAVIERLEHARLIVRDGGGITLAHEALLTQWRLLGGWVAEAREDRLLASELESDGAKWARDPETPLWQKRRLLMAEDLGKRALVQLSPSGKSFLSASRRARQRGVVVIAMGVSGVLLLASVAFVKYVRDIASREARIAEEHLSAMSSASSAALAQKRADDGALEVTRAQSEVDEQHRLLLKLGRDFESSLAALKDSVSHATTAAQLDEIKRRTTELSLAAAAVTASVAPPLVPTASPVLSASAAQVASAAPPAPPAKPSISNNIQAVIDSAYGRARAQCLKPAWDSGGSFPSMVQVRLHIGIGVDGSVTSVSAFGAPSYPNVAPCVEPIYRALKFPHLDEPTVVRPLVLYNGP